MNMIIHLQDYPVAFIIAWTLPILFMTGLLLSLFSSPTPIYNQWSLLCVYIPLLLWGGFLVSRYRSGAPRMLAYLIFFLPFLLVIMTILG